MPGALRTFSLNFVGDVMLGRLVDQLWPQHVDNAHERRVVSWFLERYPYLSKYSHRDPWGSALPLFHSADLNLINLETSVTTTNDPWPNKAFNYRMHPANLAALHEARIDYASLANNHTADFGTDGLVETIWAVKDRRIAFAGAGETTDESRRPAVLHLPRPVPTGQHPHGATDGDTYTVHIYSASDHPRDWGVVPTFHLIDYSARTKDRLRTLVQAHDSEPGPGPEHERPALKIFSIHWGPNYRWHPDDRIRELAHFLIDECGVDIVHGHSSHHVQGVERYHRKLIIYGCGDFVDDYALNEEYRNDLGAVWRVYVKEENDENTLNRGLVLDRLEIFPTRCDRFQATRLDPDDDDHLWVKRKITRLSEDMGTKVRRELGKENQIVVDLRD